MYLIFYFDNLFDINKDWKYPRPFRIEMYDLLCFDNLFDINNYRKWRGLLLNFD